MLDFLMFFGSAAAIAGIILNFRHFTFITLFGYGLALLWMMVSKGLVGLTKAMKEEIGALRKENMNLINSLIENVEKEKKKELEKAKNAEEK